MPAKDAEACMADPAAMQHCAMANRRVVADVKWRPWITVQDAAILHVRPVTDHDRLVVSAHNRRKPNARLPPQDNVPDDLGRCASQTSSAID